MANQGGFAGSTQASPLLNSSGKLYKSDRSSLSGSYEATKSYGSTIKPVRSEIDTKIIGHVVESVDTLQGLSIKYGVPVEDIRRVNKLWTNDNLHIYKILKIPLRTTSKFADLDDSDGDCDDDNDQTELDSATEADQVKIETPTKSIPGEIKTTTDSVASFLDQLDVKIKKNVKESEILRSKTEKNISTLERNQMSNARQDDLFRPLSMLSASQHRLASGRIVNKAKSDLLNSEEHFFEL